MKKHNDDRKYYEAYDDRYKAAHKKGLHWFSSTQTPILSSVIKKYDITTQNTLLELGCGEGRDAQHLLLNGFSLLATDISPEAILYCKKTWPEYEENFQIVDCINDKLAEKFDFIYAVAVVHMLLLDADRDAFYRFIYNHLENDGLALICSMGDGNTEGQSDISTAFELQERECEGQTVFVTRTSCRMINNENFANELKRNHLSIVEKGQTSIPNEFTDMMYVVVKKNI